MEKRIPGARWHGKERSRCGYQLTKSAWEEVELFPYFKERLACFQRTQAKGSCATIRPVLRSETILFVAPTLGARRTFLRLPRSAGKMPAGPTAKMAVLQGVSGLDPLDVRAEFAQFFVEMFVAAIDVINAAHLSNSFGLQSRQHQCG